ncbi:hypothetical protein [Duncaniella dubosii]|uniref:hypothetical protein n=1 Tax=Duncaniella dubosii TaxID=2518971 RepID=UPI003F664D81
MPASASPPRQGSIGKGHRASRKEIMRYAGKCEILTELTPGSYATLPQRPFHRDYIWSITSDLGDIGGDSGKWLTDSRHGVKFRRIVSILQQ